MYQCDGGWAANDGYVYYIDVKNLGTPPPP
jgi:hypothetical protein